MVGSRKIPIHIKNDMYAIGLKLALLNIDMFSGGACGSDDTWEKAYINSGKSHLMNIILPKEKGVYANRKHLLYYSIKPLSRRHCLMTSSMLTPLQLVKRLISTDSTLITSTNMIFLIGSYQTISLIKLILN